jgi:integrase
LGQSTRPEFDLSQAVWTLPRERSKNDKGHVVHLSPIAIEIFETLLTIGKKGLLFTTTGKTPVSGFGRARDRLAAIMIEKKPDLLAAAAEIATKEEREAKINEIEQAMSKPFTLHDLRRTAATGMARIGIAHHVLDRVLNHTGGKISGVAAIYNRFEYLEERKAALNAWSRYVEGLVRLAPSNVVQLAASGR